MFFIRHSIRLDHINKQEWNNHPRKKINKYDPPIAEYGKNFATQKIEKILNETNKNFTYIYSSPMTRCIETSLQFQKYIYDTFKKFVLIRIEYGLILYKIMSKNILDPYLEFTKIQQRYGKKHFDTKYVSTFSYNDINKEKSLLDSINNRIFIIKNLMIKSKSDQNKTTLICTHSENLFLLKNLLDLKYFSNNKLFFKRDNTDYCSTIRIFTKK